MPPPSSPLHPTTRDAADWPPGLQSTADVEAAARGLLPAAVVGYYASGAEDEESLRDSVAAWRRWRLVPRVLVDVSVVDTTTALLPGRPRSPSPLLLAPMAMMALAHPGGEVAMARGAAGAGVPMVVSTMGTEALEAVAAAATAGALFQLYVTKDRAFCAALVARAQAARVAALVVTVDVPVLGKREADERTGFALPPGLKLANLEGLGDREGGGDAAAGAAVGAAGGGSRLAALFQRQIDASLTWVFVDWLKTITTVPIWIKGVLSPADAATAVARGVAAVVVSNHGGRQLDGAVSTADALPAIVDAVAGAVPVYVDGGVRRGADVLRAVALGATGVLIGRPALYGLALAGQAGACNVLAMLRGELERSMALAGVASLDGVRGRRELLVRAGQVLQWSKL
jgi:isopentenyl diphosphate isomerase/L-lactate dehydrogenase-like FMN-dependent dehydrogenase